MPDPTLPDFQKIASRAYDVLAEIGYADPKEYNDAEAKKQWVEAVASVIRAEMGYDETAD